MTPKRPLTGAPLAAHLQVERRVGRNRGYRFFEQAAHGECYLCLDRNAHTHKLPATTIATQETHTGTSKPPTCTGH